MTREVNAGPGVGMTRSKERVVEACRQIRMLR